MWNTGKRKRKEGKHAGNCCLRGFLKHLVTSFEAASYIDRTSYERWRISIVFPTHFSLWSDQESVHEARRQSEAVDVAICIYLDWFCDIPDILGYNWVYSPANFYRVDWWETRLIPQNQSNSFHSVWLEVKDKRWKRRSKGNSY